MNLAEIFPAGTAWVDSQISRPRTLQAPTEVLAAHRERFEFTLFDDVNETVQKDWLVKDFLGADEFTLFVAKPGTAKSVLLLDIGAHIAAGMEWHGRNVKQGLVVFFAAERKRTTERRVAAWRKKHGLYGIPFVVAGGELDMTAGLMDAKALGAAVKRLEERLGQKCVLIIVDTVTGTFGGGDQNASRDMQRYIASVDELHRATGAHVAAIHHSGWEGDRGKGAIDLDGAIDSSFGIEVGGTGSAKAFVLKCTGANDMDEGVITGFKLESVSLGKDAEGDETTAPVVVPAKVTPNDGSNLKGSTEKALDSLRAVLAEDGRTPPAGSPGFHEGVVAANRTAWRNRFYADTLANEPKIGDATLRQRFSRAVSELTEKKRIATVGEWFWVCDA
ncbi:AAA family ATPase [Bradyrhizobium sp. WYCCWR 13023]|uniref:AAA family ATPase n=1 Tax=Bradyrhizobium zhengyangense TaxID=2911009 RepID=A0A9X1RG85_9BRAD|nr:AAA family ATPase [Bradyrhizobium sp. CCBAU 11434]MCG2630957.1 AAA family ATPase [Bradyrhizobium zhengyangense]MCG2644576.1 AAA family ATPase [Bradyrhizobium zhengyangense]MCG2672176.1 AAA family ATPase [Bradyrhizobium zhengyangense]